MDASEGTRTRTLLLNTGSPCGLAQHPSLGNKDNMAVRELLLEFTGEPRSFERIQLNSDFHIFLRPGYTPLLNLVEGLQLRDGDKDDNGLLSATDIDFTGSGDLKGTELSLELGDVVFEVDQSLGDAGLCFIGVGSGGVGGTQNLVLDGHVDS